MFLRWYCKWQVWWSRQDGATMVEYAVIATIIVIGLFATVGSFRDAIGDMFKKITDLLRQDSKVTGTTP
ncbi:MAG TPA: Flp family type IVb pilin [Symbiobacteriaceae bacterium]|nr:Flp family type IVb pilin [Symbiobacteriaceae bacterium]